MTTAAGDSCTQDATPFGMRMLYSLHRSDDPSDQSSRQCRVRSGWCCRRAVPRCRKSPCSVHCPLSNFVRWCSERLENNNRRRCARKRYGRCPKRAVLNHLQNLSSRVAAAAGSVRGSSALAGGVVYALRFSMRQSRTTSRKTIARWQRLRPTTTTARQAKWCELSTVASFSWGALEWGSVRGHACDWIGFDWRT